MSLSAPYRWDLKPVHILDVDTSVRDIVNMVAVAVIDAIVEENIRVNKLPRIE